MSFFTKFSAQTCRNGPTRAKVLEVLSPGFRKRGFKKQLSKILIFMFKERIFFILPEMGYIRNIETFNSYEIFLIYDTYSDLSIWKHRKRGTIACFTVLTLEIYKNTLTGIFTTHGAQC